MKILIFLFLNCILNFATALSAGSEVPPVLGIIQADSKFTSFGSYPIVPAGDQNADGLADFWTGDLLFKAYLFHGSRSAISSVPAITLDSAGPWGANIGDFDDDSFPDYAWLDRVTLSRLNIFSGGPFMDSLPDFHFGVDSTAVDTDLRPLFNSHMADLNSDGKHELVVWSQDQRSVLLYYAELDADSVQDLIFHAYDFPGPLPIFGTGMAVGNFSGSASPDFAISLNPDEICGCKGQVWLYLGGTDFDTIPELRFTQPGPFSESRERFGSLLTNLGDVNGDGYDELFAGPGNSADSLSYIYFGGPQFDTFPDVTITADAITANAAGDINRDGYNDLIIGFPLVSSSSAYVYVYYGGPSVDSLPDVQIYAQDLPIYTTRFGSAVAGVGDVNGDGVDDFAVGAVGLDGYGTVLVFSGTGSPTDVPGDEPDLPTSLKLYQNFPNPFNPRTTISFNLPIRSRITLSVINLLGQEVIQLLDGELSAGVHSVEWNGCDYQGRSVASGVYVCTLEFSGRTLYRKMLLMK